jgi:hypothetical protein
MRPIDLFNTALFAAVALTLAGCNASSKATEKPHAMTLEKGVDGAPNRITLSERAAQRLGLKLGKVSAASGNRLQVPSSAVFYDSDGSTWVYISPAALSFVRRSVSVERISDTVALLSKGPAIGSSVVTLGVPELQGADAGIGY